MCGTHVEVRGPLGGISALLPRWVLGIERWFKWQVTSPGDPSHQPFQNYVSLSVNVHTDAVGEEGHIILCCISSKDD